MEDYSQEENEKLKNVTQRNILFQNMELACLDSIPLPRTFQLMHVSNTD